MTEVKVYHSGRTSIFHTGTVNKINLLFNAAEFTAAWTRLETHDQETGLELFTFYFILYIKESLLHCVILDCMNECLQCRRLVCLYLYRKLSQRDPVQLERTQSAPGTTQHAGEKVLRMPRETSGKTPTLDSRGMREQRGHPTAKTQHTTFFLHLQSC